MLPESVETDILHPIITVVVLSHNRLDDLRENLLSLLPTVSAGPHELIVVDNASTDGTGEFLQRLQREWPSLKLILNASNEGVSAGRNAGMRAARGEYIVCFDDDARMSVREMLQIPRAFEKNPQAGILTFRVRHPLTQLWECDYGLEPREVSNFHGAGSAVRREVLERVGYLDEKCFYGAEELDMSIRAHAAGYKTVYWPEFTVFHNKLIRSIRIEADRRIKMLYQKVRILNKYFPAPMALWYSWRCLLRFLIPALGGLRPALATRFITAAWRGVRAGLRAHAGTPAETAAFYHDPQLRPDYGNAPLHVRAKELIDAKGGEPQAKSSWDTSKDTDVPAIRSETITLKLD